ncbi:MAG TPA: agmatine deiminase [Firmicutes bacterium]|nr:agmatine deiminase [Bacillota bacterium]
MKKINQNSTPYLDALKKYVNSNIAPFDVPGHHMGNVPNKLKSFLGDMVFKADVNAPIGMDNLANPHGVLKEAEDLMAEFCHADDAYFLINGTSSGIIAMIMTSCKANERIIMPRNVHKSIISALILSGAVPVYVAPKLDTELEIANQPTVDDYIKAMQRYPASKAVFVINPTYFGAVNDLKRIVDEAHSRGMVVLVDEAHGAHYYFDKQGPISAMDAGADMASVSFHKTGGSLTQSSVLLLKSKAINKIDLQKSLNILNTTSPSTILMASLDSAREYLVENGQKNMNKVHELSEYARKQISKINGFVPCGKEHFLSKGCFDYDETKLVIKLENLDINGFDLYQLLKKDYSIQMELAETYVVMGVLAIGNNKTQIDRLVKALKDISSKHYSKKHVYQKHAFGIEFPFQLLRPRAAFHAPGKKVLLKDAINSISKESIMIYPPGIPLIVPGEVFTKELIERIEEYKKSNVTILSDYGTDYVNVIDVDNWTRYHVYENKLNDYLIKRLTNPRADGYEMPFEGNRHSGTIILLPYRKDTWRDNAKPALDNFKKVIFAIAKYEPVFVGIHPTIYKKVIPFFQNKKNIYPIKIRYNDSWARDISPIFLLNENNKMRSVDFRFNAWGGDVDGLYSNYKDDDLFAGKISKIFGVEKYYLDDFILEGGSIHVDGEKTCLVTKACLLSEGRNPNLSDLEIEENLKTYLGVNKVIWLDHGIYEDETNEHVDNMACFIKPGVVALAWCDDKNDPQYQYCQSAYKTLKNSVDAMGRKFEIVKIKLPKPLYMSESEAKGIKQGHYNAKERLSGSRLSASYINFYQSDKFVILPAFGVNEDKIAKEQFKKLFPDKEIIQIDSREILLGGGNIHCITMQIPYQEEFIKKNEN